MCGNRGRWWKEGEEEKFCYSWENLPYTLLFYILFHFWGGGGGMLCIRCCSSSIHIANVAFIWKFLKDLQRFDQQSYNRVAPTTSVGYSCCDAVWDFNVHFARAARKLSQLFFNFRLHLDLLRAQLLAHRSKFVSVVLRCLSVVQVLLEDRENIQNELIDSVKLICCGQTSNNKTQ